MNHDSLILDHRSYFRFRLLDTALVWRALFAAMIAGLLLLLSPGLAVGAGGALDKTFSGDGKQVLDLSGHEDVAYAVAIQGNGKIIVAGAASAGARSSLRVGPVHGWRRPG